MPRETVADKATRLFEAGAVQDAGHMTDSPEVRQFSVEGDGGSYEVLASGPEDLMCDCPAKKGCAHAAAVALWLEHEELPTATETPQDPPEPSPALAVPAPQDRALIDVADAPVTWRTLEILANTEFVPAALRGRPAAVLGAVLLGRDYGLGPLEALRLIDVVDGSPEPNAELKLRLYRRAGHRLAVLEHDDKVCHLKGTRGDNGDEYDAVFTLTRAERMGLTNKSNWKKEPDDMLWARAVSRLVRRLAPDALDRT